MSAIAISPIKRQHETLTAPLPKSEGGAIQSLLDMAILQTNAQGAYVYRFDRERVTATLAASGGAAAESLGRSLAAEVGSNAVLLHWNRKTPLVLQSGAAADWRFGGFPEFKSARFDAVVSIPLLELGEVTGIANFCRATDSPLSASALAFLMSLSLPLGALLVASTLRGQLAKAQQDLMERKLVERAKALLQSRFHWTEEEAYLGLRRLSRQNRTPMPEIARTVIASDKRGLAEALDQHE